MKKQGNTWRFLATVPIDLPPVIIPLVELELLSLARAGWLQALEVGTLERFSHFLAILESKTTN